LEKWLKRSTNDALTAYKKWEMLVGKQIIVMPKKKEHTSSHYYAEALEYTNDGHLRVRVTDSQEIKNLIAEEVTIRPQ